MNGTERRPVLALAFRYSIPVLLGFLALGTAYGLVFINAGLPFILAPLSSILVYAGSGQFLLVALYGQGAGLLELALAELVLNARHIAYGISLFRRIGEAGRCKWYLVYALSDETFALISTLPEELPPGVDRTRLMVCIAVLDQLYWLAGTCIGAAAGAVIPFDFEGIGFSLTALFVVLMTEQMRRVRKAAPFIITSLVSLLAVFTLPARLALLVSLVVSLVLARAGGFAGKEAP